MSNKADKLGISTLHSNRAQALLNLGHFPQALVDCEEALRLDPRYGATLPLRRSARAFRGRALVEGRRRASEFACGNTPLRTRRGGLGGLQAAARRPAVTVAAAAPCQGRHPNHPAVQTVATADRWRCRTLVALTPYGGVRRGAARRGAAPAPRSNVKAHLRRARALTQLADGSAEKLQVRRPGQADTLVSSRHVTSPAPRRPRRCTRDAARR